jgi:hypothetical protein
LRTLFDYSPWLNYKEFTELYFQADNAVKKAKELERNRTEVYVT